MTDWQDIESARPRLFEEVLLFRQAPDGGNLICNGWLQPEQGGTPINWMCFGRFVMDAPTHWMPLPPPPKVKA